MGTNHHNKKHYKPKIYEFLKRNLSWFWVTCIVLIVTGIINYFYKITVLSIDILPIIFYVSEIAIVGFLLFRLMKIVDRIDINSNMRLSGMRLLSGIIAAVAIFIFFFLVISPAFAFFFNQLNDFLYFGKDFGLPYMMYMFLIVIFVGFCIIGGHLHFRFQRETGIFVWRR